jgi:nucleoid-associated protein YgaU
VICIIALIKLLTKKDKPTDTTSSLPQETADEIVPSQSDSEDTTPPSDTTEPDPSASETDPKPSGIDAEVTHTIVTGDSWWSICMQYYNTATEALCQKLAEYNGKNMTDHIHTGGKIKIPPLSVLTGSGD